MKGPWAGRGWLAAATSAGSLRDHLQGAVKEHIRSVASGKQPQQSEVNVQVRGQRADAQTRARRLEMRSESEIRKLDFKECERLTVQGNFFGFKEEHSPPSIFSSSLVD